MKYLATLNVVGIRSGMNEEEFVPLDSMQQKLLHFISREIPFPEGTHNSKTIVNGSLHFSVLGEDRKELDRWVDLALDFISFNLNKERLEFDGKTEKLNYTGFSLNTDASPLEYEPLENEEENEEDITEALEKSAEEIALLLGEEEEEEEEEEEKEKILPKKLPAKKRA